MNELSRELEVACRAARAAAQLHVAGRGTDLKIATKSSPIDLVTRIDTESERVIREILEDAFPEDGIVGEEEGETDGSRDRRWLVDPLDGTLNYAHGFPYYCVSIALEVQGTVRLGLVLDSVRDELFTAVSGAGAWLDGAALQVTRRSRLQESMLATGFAYSRSRMEENLELFGRVLPMARAIRRPGAAALDLAWTAAGRLDGLWELYLNPWDVAAGCLLVTEAGGRTSDERGEPHRLSSRGLVASNGAIHDELLATLNCG